jgi:hypothetical protein
VLVDLEVLVVEENQLVLVTHLLLVRHKVMMVDYQHLINKIDSVVVVEVQVVQVVLQTILHLRQGLVEQDLVLGQEIVL